MTIGEQSKYFQSLVPTAGLTEMLLYIGFAEAGSIANLKQKYEID